MQYYINSSSIQLNALRVYMRKSVRTLYYILYIFLLTAGISGCKKLVDIPAPINSITTAQTFSTEQKATSALVGIYYDMSYSKNDIGFASGSTTIQAGLYSDELRDYGNPGNAFLQNNLAPDNSTVYNSFWTFAYYDIYMANATIEGLNNSSSLADAVKNRLIGECKFLRAFCNFYLVNLFGDIPLVTTSEWAANSLVSRDSSKKVYDQIISDLKDAQNLLSDDYPSSKGDRDRANKWAATALLARVYLYRGQWDDAIAQSSAVIGKSLYSLGSLDNIFTKNSGEAIFQLQCVTRDNFAFATQEGNRLVPPPFSWAVPNYVLTSQLLSSFETGDQRRSSWANMAVVSGDTVYYPYKFKLRASSAGSINEYNTPLRLAEQYLIRAEAKAQQSKLTEAIADVDMIRSRAGLGGLSSSLDKDQVLAAIAQENRIEFFVEWGHRWFDLKRTEQADAVLAPIKGTTWQGTDILWPIPKVEITNDPNLKQNPGYQ